MNLKTKTLAHVSGLLDGFDIYPAYSKISDILIKLDIENPQRNQILDALCDETTKLKKIVSEAKDWVNSLIEDLNEK